MKYWNVFFLKDSNRLLGFQLLGFQLLGFQLLSFRFSVFRLFGFSVARFSVISCSVFGFRFFGLSEGTRVKGEGKDFNLIEPQLAIIKGKFLFILLLQEFDQAQDRAPDIGYQLFGFRLNCPSNN